MRGESKLDELIRLFWEEHRREETPNRRWRRLERRIPGLDRNALIVLAPELESVILEILKPIEENEPHQGHFQKIVRFIEKFTRKNRTVCSVADRKELAVFLARSLQEFHGRVPYSIDLVSLLFRKIQEVVVFFRGSSSSSSKFTTNRGSFSTPDQEPLILGQPLVCESVIAKAWPPQLRASRRARVVA